MPVSELSQLAQSLYQEIKALRAAGDNDSADELCALAIESGMGLL